MPAFPPATHARITAHAARKGITYDEAVLALVETGLAMAEGGRPKQSIGDIEAAHPGIVEVMEGGATPTEIGRFAGKSRQWGHDVRGRWLASRE